MFGHPICWQQELPISPTSNRSNKLPMGPNSPNRKPNRNPNLVGGRTNGQFVGLMGGRTNGQFHLVSR